MATKQTVMWKVMQSFLPKSEKVGIDQIYRVVNGHVVLQPDDWEPSAQGGVDPRWKRNVRNILQHRKLTSEILWLGNGIYLLPPSADPLAINSSVPSQAKISRQEFEKLQTTRWEIGDKGEEYAVNYERAKLISAGRPDLAKRVTRISLTNIGAGFDIESFDTDGHEKCIEVKTTMGHRRVFEWSGNEFEVGKALGDRYWVYCIRDIGDNPEIFEIQNPASKIGTLLDIKPNSYMVRVQEQ